MYFYVISVIFGFVAYYFYVAKTDLNSVIWKYPSPLGSLEKNEILRQARLVAENEIVGAESFAFDKISGNVYAGLADGRVVEFSQTGEYRGVVFFVGGYISNLKQKGNTDFSYNGVDGNDELLKYCILACKQNQLAFNSTKERECGRPLGTRIVSRKGRRFLYFIDAYYGIFMIDLTAKPRGIRYLMTKDHPLTISAGSDPTAARPFKFMNDLSVLDDETVIFSDSSHTYTRAENRQEVISGGPYGRLIEYNPRTNVSRVLLCGLHFPNGVQLLPKLKSDKEDTLLVVELTRFRILKIKLTLLRTLYSQPDYDGTSSCDENNPLHLFLDQATTAADTNSSLARSGAVSVFTRSIPGIPDNIRLNEFSSLTNGVLNDYLIVGSSSANAKPFSLLQTLYSSLVLRHIMGVLIPPAHAEKFVPKLGLVFIIGLDGKILKSLQTSSGRVSMVSEGNRHPLSGDLWIGSHSAPYVAILPAEHFPPIVNEADE